MYRIAQERKKVKPTFPLPLGKFALFNRGDVCYNESISGQEAMDMEHLTHSAAETEALGCRLGCA